MNPSLSSFPRKRARHTAGVPARLFGGRESRFKRLWFPAFAGMTVLLGCQKYYYNPAPQVLPAHIQKLAIRPFANHTQQYGLEDKLTLAVQSEFNRDGRHQITTEDQADGVLIGDIPRYILEPLSYDTNHLPT